MKAIQLAVVAGVIMIVLAIATYVEITSQSASPIRGTTSTVICGSEIPCSASLASTSNSCSSTTTTIQTMSTTDSLILEMGYVPANFSIGSYRFVTVDNGSGYAMNSSAGVESVNLGYLLSFSISNETQTQTAAFGWAPVGPMDFLPSPSSGVAFNGNLQMTWVATCTGLFLEIDA